MSFLKNESKKIIEPDLGEILFKKNINAKKYIIYTKCGSIKVTIPLYGNFSTAYNFLLKNKKKIIEIIKIKSAQPSIDIDETMLRRKAQSILPERLKKLADLHSFSYSSVKIRKSRCRWGSCSVKKNINLSFYLMLLPDHLIEYVMLHELCHTVQMNHSPVFWALLNKYTQNRAIELRNELRNYKYMVNL